MTLIKITTPHYLCNIPSCKGRGCEGCICETIALSFLWLTDCRIHAFGCDWMLCSTTLTTHFMFRLYTIASLQYRTVLLSRRLPYR